MKVMNQDDESEILHGYYGFSNIIPLGGCGGPEKGPSFVVFSLFLLSFFMNLSCQLNIFQLDGNALSMYSAQV